MNTVERPAYVPESEQNPPEDTSPGWKPWNDNGVERWWMGRQWGEAYRSVE